MTTIRPNPWGLAVGAFVLLFAARPAHARDWLVRPAPNDNPSLDDAIRSAMPGDTVTLTPGVHHGGLWIERSGEPGRPITIRAQRPGTAVIEGGGETLNIGGGAHDLVFEGLDVRGSDDNLIHVQDGAHDIVLRDLRVHDAGDDGDGIKVNQAHDIRIEHVECFHPGRRPDRPDGNPSQECIDLLDVTRAVVADCYLHDGGNMLLYAKGASRDVIFERNVLRAQGPDAIDPCLGVGASSDVELLRGRGYEAENIVVRNNVIVGCHAGAVGVYDALHAWVVNNTFVDDGPDVVQFRAGSGPRAESRDVRFANNLFVDPGGRMVHPYVLRSHGIALLDVRSDVYWNAGHPFASDGLFDVQREPGGSVADPGLAPAADEPWSQRLAVIPTRAGRDAALTLAGPGAVNDDWFGRRRPAGLRSDVGAIETDATARAAAASPAWPSTLPSPPATPTLSSAAPPPTAASAQAVARAVGRRLSAIAVFAFATLTLARRRRRVSARSVPPPPESLAWGS